MARKTAKSTANADDVQPANTAAEAPAPDAETDVTAEFSLNAGASNRPTVATELLRAEAGDVQAEHVVLERAGADHITAERVTMNNSGARTIDAKSAQVDRSGVLAVQSEKAVFYNSTAVAVAAEDVKIVRGRVLLLKAENATLEGDVRVGVYAGPAGDAMRPLLDVPAAAALGGGLGIALVLFGAILRRIFRGR